MAGYSFHKTDEGNIVCTRLNTNEETRGMFGANIHDFGFRVSGVTNDWNLSAQVAPDYDFFEYFDASDGYYYRVYISEMQTVNTPVHKLDERHMGWPTRTREQVQLEIAARERDAVEKAVSQAMELKEGKTQLALEKSAMKKRQAQVVAEATLIAEELSKFVATNGDRNTRVRNRLIDEGLGDFVNDVANTPANPNQPVMKRSVPDPFVKAEAANNPVNNNPVLTQQVTTEHLFEV